MARYSATARNHFFSQQCNNANFTNVSGSTVDLVPPNTTPPGATATFNQIWRDDLTGLHFTNILFNGTGTVRWAAGVNICAGIDSGNGPGHWRLPTQKEQLQLYVDGISKVAVTGGSWSTVPMWSISTASTITYFAWRVDMATGNSSYSNKINTSSGIFCVR